MHGRGQSLYCNHCIFKAQLNLSPNVFSLVLKSFIPESRVTLCGGFPTGPVCWQVLHATGYRPEVTITIYLYHTLTLSFHFSHLERPFEGAPKVWFPPNEGECYGLHYGLLTVTLTLYPIVGVKVLWWHKPCPLPFISQCFISGSFYQLHLWNLGLIMTVLRLLHFILAVFDSESVHSPQALIDLESGQHTE